jgi:glutamate formiminotransferase
LPNIGRINIFILKKKRERPERKTIFDIKRYEYKKIKLGILKLLE